MSQTNTIYKYNTVNILVSYLKSRESIQENSMRQTEQFQILKFRLNDEEYNLKLNLKMAISTGIEYGKNYII